MKVLISITGWVKGAVNGEHQAMRDTFLKDVSKFQGLDYRFFIGDGSPVEEDETSLQRSWSGSGKDYTDKNNSNLPSPFSYDPKSDEVILHVPDDYLHHGYKTREGRRWAVDHGFDFVFQCFTDTYIDIPRLMSSGFEKHDWSGSISGNPSMGFYAGGGPGYWNSRKASEQIVGKPVDVWAEDWWVGTVLNRCGTVLNRDQRYTNYPNRPGIGNDFITSHLANTPTRYDKSLMYALWKAKQ